VKKIEIPKKLLSIKFPWNITSNNLRLEKSNKLCRNEENIENALDSLTLSLCTLSTMTSPEGINIPDELSDYWSFTAESIAQEAHSFDGLNYSLLQKVIDLYQVDPSSDQILEEMAEMWVWTTTLDISGDILRWIRNNFDKNKDLDHIESLLNIASKYWKQVPHNLSSSLISASYRLSEERSLPLLKEVENTSSILSQGELARDYRKLLIESSVASPK
jgi:hypothetical protein